MLSGSLARVLLIASSLLLPLAVFSSYAEQIGAEEVPPEKNVSICFYYLDASLEFSRQRIGEIVNTLRKADAKILVLAGVKIVEVLKSIAAQFTKLTFSRIVKAHDSDSNLAMLSSIEPAEFNAITNIEYVIRDGIKLPVMRGFMHAIMDIDGYLLHIIAADLKNREKHPEHNQTDMRRYEARRLRQVINDIQKKDIASNIMLLGNLNDTCGKSPIKDIYNRRFGINKRLFDLRPLDKLNVSWTYLCSERDVYERLDYAIVSSALIPEVDYDKLRIVYSSDWQKASTHRAIVVHVSPAERVPWTDDKINQAFPYTIRTPEYVSMPPPIGEKRLRGTE